MLVSLCSHSQIFRGAGLADFFHEKSPLEQFLDLGSLQTRLWNSYSLLMLEILTCHHQYHNAAAQCLNKVTVKNNARESVRMRHSSTKLIRQGPSSSSSMSRLFHERE